MDTMDTDSESDEQINAEEEEALLKSDGDDPGNEKATVEDIDDDEDSGDSDGDEDQTEDSLLKEYAKTLKSIEQNIYNYDNYVRLVDIAHELSDLEKIRQSCEKFSAIYPLSPQIWLRWLKTESSIATSQEEIKKVEKLFQRALNDYYSADVALEYAKFAYKSTICEDIWDECLSCYAYHCMKGREFFVLWRKYIEKNESLSESEKLELIIKMYKKELQIPLNNIEESYIELKVLCQKNKSILSSFKLNWNDIDKKYNIVKEQLQIMLPYEKQLQELNDKYYQERSVLYKRYIKDIQKYCSHKILQILYERMITDCCLNETCWIDYCNYLEERLDDDEFDKIEDEMNKYELFAQTTLNIIDRGIKNCTWSYQLYIYKLRLYEDNNFNKKSIKETFEQSLEAGFQQPEPFVNLWLEYLSYLTRNTDFKNDEEVGVLRNNFDFAWNSLGRQWGVLADCNCEILQFWGRLEYEKLNGPLKGRELWYTVMESSDNATKSGLWIEFIHLEMKSDYEAARKLFSKALTYDLDDHSVIMLAWKRFERCYGDLKNIKYCEKICESVLNRLNVKYNTENKSLNKKSGKNLKRKSNEQQFTQESSSTSSSVKEEKKDKLNESPFKKPKLVENDNTNDLNKNQKMKNVTKEHENDEIDLAKDHLRIFLSNLDYNITENEIQEAFPELSIISIDLIKSGNGRGRGFGYAELSSKDDVEKALSFDNRLIKGRPVYISSVLRDKEKRQKFKYSDKLEPTKLFVRGIPYDATNEELRSLFEKYGKLKDVRIVYHKSGKSKGIAYIEYEDETAASIAVMKLDQYELRDYKLNVAISAPPPKPSKETLSVKKLLGVTKNSRIKTEQKPRMNLIPTSVRKLATASGITSQQNGSKSAGQTSTTVKSNEDFRKELLGLK